MKQPTHLKPGAKVAILSGSGRLKEGELEHLKSKLALFDIEPIFLESATARYGYLAGDDNLRAKCINDAFADKEIDAIWSTRGGYGMHRVLPLLDFDMIAKNPKPLMGYSDVTALHMALNNLGIQTYHAPMPTAGKAFEDEFTRAHIDAMLWGPLPTEYKNPDQQPLKTVVGGTCTGELVGGNMALVAFSLGTPWQLDTKGKILFLEDVNEPPYKIDGMLTNIRNAGLFADCAGVVLGAFTGCVSEDEERGSDFTIEQIVGDLISPAGKPTVSGLVCGHCVPSMVLPFGLNFELNATEGTLTRLV